MPIRLQMLGAARVVLRDGTPHPVKATVRDQALVYLALTGDWVARDRLGFLFWADSSDTAARHNVRQLLKRIRQLEWIEGFESSDAAVKWSVPNDVADLDVVIADQAWDELPESGDLLPGLERNSTVEFEGWLLDQRRQVQSVWKAAVVAAAQQAEAQGDPSRGMKLLEPLLAGDDGAEALPVYMELAVKAGHRALAIAGFDRVAIRLRHELGQDPPAGASEIARRLTSDSDTQPTKPEPSELSGRDTELAEIAGLLALPECRLLTLLGPAGIGKSTIAHEVLGLVGDRHIDGGTLVSLEAVADPDDLAASIASELGVSLDARAAPIDQLIAAIRDRQMVLVLDNLEHLRPAWTVFSQILDSCLGLKLVITSRERLRLDGEWIYEITGLSDIDGVDLFLEMGRRVAPGVSVSTDEASAVCQVVGGSPLGIELAVPWLRVMSPSEIVLEIQRDQEILSGGHRDGPPRHQSVAATMKHSWDLAPAHDREAVEALSVFASPFTRELAMQVGGATATVLRDLLDQSLVQRRQNGTYFSHPLVGGYAAERLAEDTQRHMEVRRRHAIAVLGVAESATDASAREPLLEDVIVAWQAAVEFNDIDLIEPAVDWAMALLVAAGRTERGLQLLAGAAERAGRAPPEQAAILATLKLAESRLLYLQARHGEAALCAEDALRAATDSQDRRLRVKTSLALGWARKWIADDQAQHQTISESLRVAEELGDRNLIAEVLNGLGCSAPTLTQCQDHLQDGLDHVDNDAPLTRAGLLNNLGMVCWALGKGSEGIGHVEAALDIAKSEGDHNRTVDALSSLAFLHADIGDFDTALSLSADAESSAGVSQVLDTRIYAYLIAGEIHRLCGDTDGARSRARRALAMAESVKNEAFALRSLRLRGQLLVDGGETDRGLGILAFVLANTASKGGDFTSEIINPNVWEEATRNLDPERIEAARLWAGDRDLDDLIDGWSGPSRA